MNFKINYKVNNKMVAPDLSDVSLDYEIGVRFDRFVEERVAGRFAVKEVLREAERCFKEQYDDEYCYGVWRSEFWGKLMISAVRVCRMKQDKDLKADIKDSVYRVLSYQSADGYISAYRDGESILPCDPEISMREVDWACNYNWNVWGQKYTLWALLEAAMYLDDKIVLNAAAKLADRLIAQIERLGIRVKDAGVMHGMAASSIMKPMLILYRLTADERYLNFCLGIAKEFDREDGEVPNLIANALSGIPVSKWYSAESEWYAKAYEMMSCFDGIIELYRLTGTERLFAAAKAYWELLNKYEVNILGSAGYCERLADAKEYPDSATEICDAIHWMRISYELFLLTAEPKYAEALERAFLNAFLAGVYEDGRAGAFFVRSAGRHWIAEAQVGTKYQNCCLNNVGRGFANMAEAIVTKSDNDFYINSYIPATVDHGNTSFRISFGYTESGNVAITVRGARKGSVIYLRMPEWCNNATLAINGEPTSYANVRGQYVAIPAREGDFVARLKFEMKAEVIDFNGTYVDLPATDYHRRRWCDNQDGFCNRGAMVYGPMSIIKRGPVLLARSKRVGCKEEDMFSGKTVWGKNATCDALTIRHDHLLTACKITLNAGDEKIEYTMCDYASAANRDLEDARYFTVFV